MSRAHSLFRLQEIDLALDKNNDRLEEIQRILTDSEELQRANATLSRTSSALREVNVELKNAEYAVEAQRVKIGESEHLLYGGHIKNPKELQDLQMEVESLKRYLSSLEDQWLDVMVNFEQAEMDHETAQNILTNIEQSQQAEHQDLEKERKRLRDENEQLLVDREAILVSVSEDDLKLYRQLREKQGGVAVARLENDGSCSICGLSPSASQQQLIRAGTRLEQCKQCRRILYAG